MSFVHNLSLGKCICFFRNKKKEEKAVDKPDLKKPLDTISAHFRQKSHFISFLYSLICVLNPKPLNASVCLYLYMSMHCLYF